MTRTRKLIIAFWIFIIAMLLWQFYTYDQSLTQTAVEHPTQQHFWFTNSASATPAAPTPAHHDGPDVQQTAYTVANDTPGRGSMTCRVTLTNKGNAKAVGVQIDVRPFRGASNYDEDAGNQKVVLMNDNDPISQIGQWVTFPDLAPGESNTQSVVFLSRHYTVQGTNPTPEILFQNEKSQSQTQSPSQPQVHPQRPVLPGAGG